MREKLRFCVMGGDLRQVRLAEMLADEGHGVSLFGFERLPEPPCVPAVLTPQRIGDADCVILPLPVTDAEGKLNLPLSDTKRSMEWTLSQLSPRQIICAGRVSAPLSRQAAERGLLLHDYFAREELAIANAVPTAEGAIQLAMEELPITLHGARTLVIGFGRTGKLLAHRLAAIGANVSVAARKYSDLAWIEAYGYTPEHSEELSGWLCAFDLVINTVPMRLLTEEHLRELKADCLCIDVASVPGGIDFDAAARLGVKAIWALSLPGKVAPVTSGKIIKNTIYNILYELGS